METVTFEDFKIGDTYIQPFVFTNPAGDPVPQAGKEYVFTLKLNPSTADEQADLYVTHTVPESTDALAGVFYIETSATASLAPTTYYAELIEVTGGQRFTLATGRQRTLF